MGFLCVPFQPDIWKIQVPKQIGNLAVNKMECVLWEEHIKAILVHNGYIICSLFCILVDSTTANLPAYQPTSFPGKLGFRKSLTKNSCRKHITIDQCEKVFPYG